MRIVCSAEAEINKLFCIDADEPLYLTDTHRNLMDDLKIKDGNVSCFAIKFLQKFDFLTLVFILRHHINNSTINTILLIQTQAHTQTVEQ